MLTITTTMTTATATIDDTIHNIKTLISPAVEKQNPAKMFDVKIYVLCGYKIRRLMDILELLHIRIYCDIGNTFCHAFHL